MFCSSRPSVGQIAPTLPRSAGQGDRYKEPCANCRLLRWQRYLMPSCLLRCAGGLLLLCARDLPSQDLNPPPIVLPQQPAAPAGKRYSVSGSVFNSVTNEPVRRALVQVNSGNEQHSAFTGSDGRFQMDGIPEGTAMVSAQRPGYFDPRFLPNRSGMPVPSYTVGSGGNDFRVPLTPESGITGTVLDADGEPIENVQVQLLAQQMVNGRKQWQNRGAASTDEQGSYSIGELMPGSVVVCTAAQSATPMAAANAESFPPKCFPDSPDVQSAQIIDVQPGQQARADFKLISAPAFTVSGIVAGIVPGMGMGAWVEGPEGMQMQVAHGGVDPSTGRFMIRSVPNGSWNIHFQGGDRKGNLLEAIEPVTVSGADVRGRRVVLQPGADIPIEIVRASAEQASPANQEGTQPQPPNGAAQTPQVQVHLTPVTGAMNGQQYYSSQLPNEDGTFDPAAPAAVRSVPPGSYQVGAQVMGQGCVSSVSSGSMDLSRQPLIVSAGSAPPAISVTLRNDCASIDITLHTDVSGSSAYVLVLADAPHSEPQILSIQTNGGSVTVSNLSPGSYRVYAVEDVQSLEYTNPEALRNLPSQSLSLEPNGKAALTLELPARGSSR